MAVLAVAVRIRLPPQALLLLHPVVLETRQTQARRKAAMAEPVLHQPQIMVLVAAVVRLPLALLVHLLRVVTAATERHQPFLVCPQLMQAVVAALDKAVELAATVARAAVGQVSQLLTERLAPQTQVAEVVEVDKPLLPALLIKQAVRAVPASSFFATQSLFRP